MYTMLPRNDNTLLKGSAHTPDKDSKSGKKEAKRCTLTIPKHVNIIPRLPKVDDELHARTIFEQVAVEAHPAKTKPKTRSKLKWKESPGSTEKTEESKSSNVNSDQAIRLDIKIKKEPGQKKVATKQKLGKDTINTDKKEQSILWMIIRKILEEILIWFIIIMILIITRIRG
uniref:Uncharacterized protein n=1 Tax=Onchocerca volvulus TaxID=6282 RepID=A0A8R1XPH8_ONCVO